ncbi:hypothetical protein D0866_02204 [Hortaea werneckii]|uniref:Uncharacterized protein n=1 Tax=Hortaea werneckii TaxID=91943 RepID=A0A3M7BGU8_HORWE|nr:hypothetical protein D0866_02204 [Hortaea werneckii]
MTTPVSSFASHHCDTLAYPNPYTTSLSILLVLGIFISYIPQHYKIIKCGTSEGLSPWWVLLGGLSSIAAMGNILTLPASREDMMCCREISGGACASALLGVVQIGVQWGCFMFVVMLYLTFFPGTSDHELAASSSSLRSAPQPSRRNAVLVGSTTLFAVLTVGIISTALVFAWPHHTQFWANTLGSIAGVLSAIQYLPQIWYTWRLGDVKSLSYITMFIQVPGAFVFAFSLWNRGVLLCLAISYYLARLRLAKEVDDRDDYPRLDDVDGTAEPGAEVNEQTSLLSRQNQRGDHRASYDTARNKKRASYDTTRSKGRASYESTRSKTLPIGSGSRDTHRSDASKRHLSQLYAATPPEIDSDRSSSSGNDNDTGATQGQGTRQSTLSNMISVLIIISGFKMSIHGFLSKAEEVHKHSKNPEDRQHLHAIPPQSLARPPGVQNPERPSALASRRQQSPRPVETEVAKAKIQTQSDGTDNGGRDATVEGVVVESNARPGRTGDRRDENKDGGHCVRPLDEDQTEGKTILQESKQKFSGAKREVFKLGGLSATSHVASAENPDNFADPHSFGVVTASVRATDINSATLIEERKASIEEIDKSTGNARSGRDHTGRPSSGESSELPSSEDTRLPADFTKTAFDVEAALLPAQILLKLRLHARTEKILIEASAFARRAHQSIRGHKQFYSTVEGRALAGRCCFYIGVCRVARQQLDGRDHSPCKWFQKAIQDAKGSFEEAEWAESWLDVCEGERMIGNDAVGSTMSSSPPQHHGSSGSTSSAQKSHSVGHSVVSGLWKAVVGESSSPTRKRSELPLLRAAFPKRKQVDAEQGIDEERLSLASERDSQAGTVSPIVETQPLFTTVYTQSPESYEPGVVQTANGRSWDSDHCGPQVLIVDDDSPISEIPHNATGGLVPIEALKSPRSPLKTPAPKTNAISRPSVLKRQSTDNTSPKSRSPRYFITNPDTPSSPNATEPDEGPLLPVHKEPGYQPPTSESPRHSPRKSVVFDALPSLIKRESVSASTSPTKVGVAARRRLSQALSSSFHAISTATAPDILEQAEEGQSPFRSTFSERDREFLTHRRRKSTPEEMV